ncbi:CoA-dependent acyltransferase, partial [Jaminaea rosea]
RLFSSTTHLAAKQPYNLADVGEGITECEVVKWHVSSGDTVEEFDPLCEVQSDKASVEITSRFSGVVSDLACEVGGIVKVGSPLCNIDQGIEAASSAPAQVSQPAKSPAMNTPASSGFEEAAHFDASAPGIKGLSPQVGIERHPNAEAIQTLATPAVRRLCHEHSLNVASISGTGKDGRVTKEDVLRHAGLTVDNAPARARAAASSPMGPVQTGEPQPLTGIRKAMFKALSHSAAVPIFTFTEEIDVTELEALRKQVNADLAMRAKRNPASMEGQPSKVTLLSFLVKALSTAMHDNPLFLTRLQFNRAASAARLIPRAAHDISIALSTPNGLLTPTIRSVEGSTVLDLASRISFLQKKATSTGLGAAETGDGGTITLSNIGSIGGGLGGTTPVLPPTGQLAIGALGRIVDAPRYSDTVPGGSKEGVATLVRRKILPVTFAGDHRVLQGTELANLVMRWKDLCERP